MSEIATYELDLPPLPYMTERRHSPPAPEIKPPAGLGTCQLCSKECSPFLDWHPDCYVDYRDFIEKDFLPLIRTLAGERPLELLYALDPEFRADLNRSIIRPSDDL